MSIARRASPSVTALAWFGAATGAGCGASDRRSEPAYPRNLQPRLDALIKDMRIPAAVVVLRSSQLGDWSATFGHRTADGTEPVRLANHFRIASNTKTITGTLILQLIQEEELRLDDPVSKYRPEVPNGANITIEQLLTMRSGLFNYTESPDWKRAVGENHRRVWTPEELVALGLAHPPYFPPGQGFHYSNTNTVLLGLIIEQLTGQPLERVMQERIFDRLELKNTSMPARTSNVIPDPHARGYIFGQMKEFIAGKQLRPEQVADAKAGIFKPTDVTDTNPSMAWAAGNVISTADDFARYVKALVAGGLLDAQLQQRRLDSLQPADPADPTGMRYGFQMQTFGPMIGHSGEIPGFGSMGYHDPKRDLTMVVWTTVSGSPDGRDTVAEIGKAIIDELYRGSPQDPD